jgi:predicted DNA-binding transcriptional regulator AlpA
MDSRLIGIDQLVDLLAEKSRQSVYNKLNRGVLPVPTYRVGRSLRWKLSEVLEYIDSMQPVN